MLQMFVIENAFSCNKSQVDFQNVIFSLKWIFDHCIWLYMTRKSVIHFPIFILKESLLDIFWITIPAFSENSFRFFYEGHRNNLDIKQPKSFILKIIKNERRLKLKKVTIIKHIGDCRNKIMHFNEELSSTYHDLEIKTLLLQKSSLLVCSFAVSAQKNSFCFAMYIFYPFRLFEVEVIFQWPS